MRENKMRQSETNLSHQNTIMKDKILSQPPSHKVIVLLYEPFGLLLSFVIVKTVAIIIEKTQKDIYVYLR